MDSIYQSLDGFIIDALLVNRFGKRACVFPDGIFDRKMIISLHTDS